MRQTKLILKGLLHFLGVYLACTILFLIAFIGSDLFTNLKVITGIFYLYLFPGFIILLFFTNLNFIEKLILGGIIGYTLVGIIAYYLNVLFYVSFRLALILPILVVIICSIIRLRYHKIS